MWQICIYKYAYHVHIIATGLPNLLYHFSCKNYAYREFSIREKIKIRIWSI